MLVLLLAAWFFVNSRHHVLLVAVSVFDNETGIADYDRPIAALADLVVKLAGDHASFLLLKLEAVAQQALIFSTYMLEIGAKFHHALEGEVDLGLVENMKKYDFVAAMAQEAA